MDDDDELAVIAERLIGQVEALSIALMESNDNLSAYGRHSRRLIRGLLASFVVLALVIAGMIWLVLQNRTSIERAKDDAAHACAESNGVRANNVVLWEEVFRISAQPNATPEEIKRIEDFRAFVAKTFKPRDCTP